MNIHLSAHTLQPLQASLSQGKEGKQNLRTGTTGYLGGLILRHPCLSEETTPPRLGQLDTALYHMEVYLSHWVSGLNLFTHRHNPWLPSILQIL